MKTNRSFTIFRWNPKGGYIERHIRRLIYRYNNSFFAFISGMTGTGKSYSALWLCEKLDPDFNVDRVCFTDVDFMDMIRNPKKYGLKRGSCILFDEISVTLDSKKHLSRINKNLKRVFSTLRSRGYIIVATSPFKTFLEKSVRNLLHVEFQTLSIDRENKKVISDCRELQFDDNANQGQGKLYRKRFRIVKNGKLYPLNPFKFCLPNKELIEEYEIKKSKFQDELYKESHEDAKYDYMKGREQVKKYLNKKERDETKEPPKLTEKEKALKDYLEEGHTDKQAQQHFDVSKVAIWKKKKNIFKKGYEIGGYYPRRN